jgi:ArsR family transcriptional regulator
MQRQRDGGGHHRGKYHRTPGQRWAFAHAGNLARRLGLTATMLLYRIKTMNDQPCTPDTCAPGRKRDALPLGNEEQELADLAKALGHPARVRILKILIERNACICRNIVEEIPLAQSTVSQHLKQLQEAGLIQGEIDGPRVCYCIDAVRLKRLKVLIASL